MIPSAESTQDVSNSFHIVLLTSISSIHVTSPVGSAIYSETIFFLLSTMLTDPTIKVDTITINVIIRLNPTTVFRFIFIISRFVYSVFLYLYSISIISFYIKKLCGNKVQKEYLKYIEFKNIM